MIPVWLWQLWRSFVVDKRILEALHSMDERQKLGGAPAAHSNMFQEARTTLTIFWPLSSLLDTGSVRLEASSS